MTLSNREKLIIGIVSYVITQQSMGYSIQQLRTVTYQFASTLMPEMSRQDLNNLLHEMSEAREEINKIMINWNRTLDPSGP